eukprot:4144412-Pyramimonas_sp.AAC.1
MGLPKIGRGCKFPPFKSGPSMAAELKVGNAWGGARGRKATAAARRRHQGVPLLVLRCCPEDGPRGAFRAGPRVLPDDAQGRRLGPRREVPRGRMGTDREEGLYCAEL